VVVVVIIVVLLMCIRADGRLRLRLMKCFAEYDCDAGWTGRDRTTLADLAFDLPPHGRTNERTSTRCLCID